MEGTPYISSSGEMGKMKRKRHEDGQRMYNLEGKPTSETPVKLHQAA